MYHSVQDFNSGGGMLGGGGEEGGGRGGWEPREYMDVSIPLNFDVNPKLL